MFVGHTAVALAAKSRHRAVSLAWFIVAAFALDLLWPVFLLAGVEHVRIAPYATAFNNLGFVSYPWSHSLLMSLVWGAAAFGICRWRGLPASLGGWMGGLVVSHWVLDFAVHAPDLPLWPGHSPRVGLGLWNSIPGTLGVEGALFLAGIALYIRGTRSRNRLGSVILWTFLLTSAWMWASGPWSPPPPSERVLAWFSLGGWLLVLWAGWADRYRVARNAT